MAKLLDDGTFHMEISEPPPKLAILYDQQAMEQYEYVILEGGRGGAKTETLGQFFVVNSMSDGGDILCLREIQNSINESVYKVLIEWIEKLELREYFFILKNEIVNRQSGAKFIFKGMKGSVEHSTIQSTKGIKYVWYEEAQTAQKAPLEKLTPTIRENGRRFYFSMNPDTIDDVIPNTIGKRQRCLRIHINYTDNQYCPQCLKDEAEECRVLYPDDYEHIWLGKPRGDGDRQTVVSQAMLWECVDAHKLLGNDDGHAYGGLDLASGEMKRNDKNALAIVKGPVVKSAEEWRSGDLNAVASHTNDVMGAYNAIRLYYDAVGVGGFAEKTLKATNPIYAVVPYMGQHSPMGEEKYFIRTPSQKITNKDFFKNLKAQIWWNIRLRAENTVRMKRGFKTMRPEYYLSFDSGIKNLDNLIREMSQATWAEDNSGRIIINKTPADYKIVIDGKSVAMRSPNRADSVGSALLRSCRSGLRANR
jgi:phage terminase large subunit